MDMMKMKKTIKTRIMKMMNIDENEKMKMNANNDNVKMRILIKLIKMNGQQNL